jgi:hypothetical protein
MRYRRTFLLMVPVLALAGACGGDPGPDMGSATLPTDGTTETGVTLPGGSGAIGDTAGEMVAATSTSTTTTTIPIPTTSTDVDDDAESTTDPAAAADIEAVCQRVQILIVTAQSMGPSLTDAEMSTIVDGIESIGQEVSTISADLGDTDAGSLDECVAELDDLPI